MAPDRDDKVGFGDGAAKRGWTGTKAAPVYRQDRSRLRRYSDVTDTYDYPGFDGQDEEDD